MGSFLDNMTRVANAIGREVGHFDESTWAILTMSSIILGYFLLRGQSHGR